jgi:hypothetical protein
VTPESQQNPAAKLNFSRDIAPVAAIIRIPIVMAMNSSFPAVPEIIVVPKPIPARSKWRRPASFGPVEAEDAARHPFVWPIRHHPPR